jgi:hypothetical protein
MNDTQAKRKYIKVRLKDGLYYCRDAGGILILRQTENQSILLGGVEAALWDWLQLLAWDEVIRMVSVFLRVPKEVAEDRVAGILSSWRYVGLLEFIEE